MDMEDNDRKMAENLMFETRVAILATIDEEGYPQTRALFNLRNKDRYPKLIQFFEEHREDFMILFSTNTSSSKIRDLKHNCKVTVYYCLPNQSRGLMLRGEMEIVDDVSLKKTIWHDGWERYYPLGYDDPDHTVLRMYPVSGRGWNESHTYRFEI